MKISIIGAGSVGTTCANILAYKEIASTIVLLDIKKGLAEGKALDLWQTAPIELYDTKIIGSTNDYTEIVDSQVVVITSGLPRKPGMSRDDLIEINGKIVKEVTTQVMRYAPEAIIIVVANPLDVMTYQAHLTSGLSRTKVMGMSGILDTARYRSFLADALQVSPKDIQAVLLGGHGDSMVPLPRYTTVGGIPVTALLDQDRLDKIIKRTRVGGGEIVELLGSSAFYAPGAAAAQMVTAIVKNQRRVLPVCVKLTGEYGIDHCYLSVPVILGKNGIEKIIDLDLQEEEKKLLEKSKEHVQKMMAVLA